jgi:hypothetical protein
MKSQWHSSAKKLEMIFPYLNEKQKRILAAAEAEQLGKGGISFISVQLQISRLAIQNGLKELHKAPSEEDLTRIRRKGGGRKKLTEKQPGIKEALLKIVTPVTRGDPESPLLWTSKSCAKIALELHEQGFQTSPDSVERLLKEENYSLQANKKTKEGKKDHPDRDKQFQYINKSATEMMCLNQPVISVDTKKKELIGEYKNHGKEWSPSGKPTPVLSHDFPDPKVPKAIPYGVYDIGANSGFVNVGTDHDTSTFAVESIRTWWRTFGIATYPDSKKIMICADSGGSNGVRSRVWKAELQKFANDTGLSIEIFHLPPGTSKWNKIEHRIFSEISKNWRGKPLLNYKIVVNSISATTTKTGLKVKATLDKRKYEVGIKVLKSEFEQIKIEKSKFHGEWNYTIHPN